MPKQLYIAPVVQGKRHCAIMKGRRETIYKMLSKKNEGIVPCFVCGKPVKKDDATLEHIVEKVNGGTDDMSNLSISHGPCNWGRANNKDTGVIL